MPLSKGPAKRQRPKTSQSSLLPMTVTAPTSPLATATLSNHHHTLGVRHRLSAAASPRASILDGYGRSSPNKRTLSIDSRDDNELVFHSTNSMSSSNSNNNGDRQRPSPRSLSSMGSMESFGKARRQLMGSRSRLVFASLLVATIWCGVINMASLSMLPLHHDTAPGTAATSSSTSASLLRFLTGLSKVKGEPRVVYLGGLSDARMPVAIRTENTTSLLSSSAATSAATTTTTTLISDTVNDDCVPMADWQTQSFPTCNTLHEIDVRASTWEGQPDDAESALEPLGEGWFRTTWRMDTVDEVTVLKTLRVVRDFTPEFFELHRRDATAMERLTASNFVMDVYAYCGQSAVNELADFPYDNVKSLEDFDRRLRGRDSNRANAIKLRMAASVASGLADIHAVESIDGRPAMVHYDLNPRNVALCAGGRPKLNDFNIAEFLQWNPKTNATCGFPSRMHEPWWRAPEEMNLSKDTVTLLDDKVDVYALGNILFHILTTHSPRGKMKKERMEAVRPLVAQGVAPEIPEPFASSSNPYFVAFRQAMELCFAKEPKDRGTADEVAGMLTKALIRITAEEEASDTIEESPDEPVAAKIDANADDDKGESVEERE